MFRDLLVAMLLAFVLATSVCGRRPADPGSGARDGTESSDGARVTYIANEGVMIEAGGKKILIDALHRFYKDAYAFPPDPVREDLENAKGKFADVDLVLVSHIHGDHFSAESVGRHLISNPNASLVSSPQVVEAVARDFPKSAEIGTRLRAIPYEWKQANSDSGGIRVTLLGLRHANPQFASIQNFGHLIDVGGIKFLHIGDADMTDENFDAFALNKAGIDVAFIPYWFLLSKEGRELVDRQFKPKNIVAVHVPPSEAKQIKTELEAGDPRVAVFSEILETRTF